MCALKQVCWGEGETFRVQLFPSATWVLGLFSHYQTLLNHLASPKSIYFLNGQWANQWWTASLSPRNISEIQVFSIIIPLDEKNWWASCISQAMLSFSRTIFLFGEREVSFLPLILAGSIFLCFRSQCWMFTSHPENCACLIPSHRAWITGAADIPPLFTPSDDSRLSLQSSASLATVLLLICVLRLLTFFQTRITSLVADSAS